MEFVILFCLMMIVAGLKQIGVFGWMAKELTQKKVGYFVTFTAANVAFLAILLPV